MVLGTAFELAIFSKNYCGEQMSHLYHSHQSATEAGDDEILVLLCLLDRIHHFAESNSAM